MKLQQLSNKIRLFPLAKNCYVAYSKIGRRRVVLSNLASCMEIQIQISFKLPAIRTEYFSSFYNSYKMSGAIHVTISPPFPMYILQSPYYVTVVII
jgi:hypothetical protein